MKIVTSITRSVFEWMLIVAACLAGSTPAFAGTQSSAMPVFTPQQITLSGVALSYFDEGRGDAILVLHDGSMQMADRDHLLTLGEGSRVVIADINQFRPATVFALTL